MREVTGEDPGHVVVIGVLGAPQRRLLRGRRARAAAPEPDPEPVTTTRATLVDAERLGEAGEAGRWLRAADGEALAAAALNRLNRVLHAHRVATADPYAHEVSREQAIVTRIGYGTGDDVADGRWEEARELPRPGERGARPRRTAALRPQERLAALLSGRDAALACEDLVLRARADLDAGRDRQAALQLRVALDAGLAELEAWRGAADLGERLDELAAQREPVAGAAEAAAQGGLSPAQGEAVAHGLRRLEAALRARTARGVG